MIMSMVWVYVSELRHHRAYFSYLGWYMSMKNHSGMISTIGNSWFVHQSSLASLPAELSSTKAGGTGEGSDEFGHTKYFVYTSKGTSTYVLPNVVIERFALRIREVPG
jgi:hypothetical protein